MATSWNPRTAGAERAGGTGPLAPIAVCRLQRRGACVVDVRRLDEWRRGHIAGAVHLPLPRLARQHDRLDARREIIVVCEFGNRSQVAALLLRELGFGCVRHIAGGMVAWRRQQLPVVRSPG